MSEQIARYDNAAAPLSGSAKSDQLRHDEPQRRDAAAPATIIETIVERLPDDRDDGPTISQPEPAEGLKNSTPVPAPVTVSETAPRRDATPTSIEIGRIEVIVAAAPTPAPWFEAPRSRGFASHDKRRLGPR